jgi:arylsulfatase A-like enzyme
MAAFQACIRYTDREIQTLFDAVHRLGLEDSTVILFTNDHGVAAHRAKSTAYEAGTGVSLLVRGPGIQPAVVDHLVQNIDLAPTLLEAGGVSIPPEVQGRSFWPLLIGEDYTPHDQIFTERNYHGGAPSDQPMPTTTPHPGYDPMRTVRTDRYHYIRHLGQDMGRYWLPHEVVDRLKPGYKMWWDRMWPEMTEPRPEEELFDLQEDPNEWSSLAADPAYADIKEDLAGRVDDWMKQTGDPILGGPIPDRMNPWPAV